MAKTLPQITATTEAEATTARAEVVSVQALASSAPQRTQQLDLVHPSPQPEQNDYWIERDGLTFAGIHIIIDMWDATNLDDEPLMQRTLRQAVVDAGATLLHIHTHKFSQGGGISGVAVLAESHISVHTWPERDFAAFDIFMCGCAEPMRAIAALKHAFKPRHVNVVEHKRGIAV